MNHQTKATRAEDSRLARESSSLSSSISSIGSSSLEGKGDQRLSGPVQRQLPCPARGMPADHDFDSANFSIPQDMEHGADLICSYEACRYEGIKFLYCLECARPVTSTTFRHHHDHTSIKMESQNSPDLNGCESTKNSSSPRRLERNNKSSLRTSKRRKHLPLNANGETYPTFVTFQSNPNKRKRKMPPSVSNEKKNPVSESDESQDSNIQEQQLRWAELLKQRPDDSSSDNMLNWLMSVLEVSNCHSPTKPQTSATNNDSPADSNIPSSEPTGESKAIFSLNMSVQAAKLIAKSATLAYCEANSSTTSSMSIENSSSDTCSD